MLHFNIICSGTLAKLLLSSQKRSHSRAVLLFFVSKLMLLIFQTSFALSAVNCLLILANQKAFPTFPTPQNDRGQGDLFYPLGSVVVIRCSREGVTNGK